MGAASEERSSLMSRPDEPEAAEPARRVAALALAVGLSVAAVAGAGGVRRLIAGDAFAETPLRFRVANPEYGDAAPASLALYPFAHVGEPHRASRLTAEDAVDGATYAYYRAYGECVECPTSQAWLIALLVVGAAGAGGLAYLLKKRRVEIAVLAIGVCARWRR